jgi:hypothetical protein
MLENIRDFYRNASRQNSYLSNAISELEGEAYNLFTTYPHKLWKTIKTPSYLKVFLVFLCVVFLFSCSSSKKAKKGHPALDNAVISMTGEEVRNKLGEPNIVSKTPENKIIWTYLPSWKILPDNKDTIYIEFEDNKVVKVIKAK